MHIFNMFVAYLQWVKKIQEKDWKDLISKSMHYHLLFTRCSCQKMARLKTLYVCQKNIFSALNFFMHIFSISVIYLQSTEKIPWKL